ncbi:MAG: hypothetical protein AAGC93_12875 [Cyanobacteria bacterium P01_F01_bin.53]
MGSDIVSITASAITGLAFKKFIESGAGELGKQFTTEALVKMDVLLKSIWRKLQGKPRIEEVKKSVEKNKQITTEQVHQITAYLQVAMDEDQQFANNIRLLAQEINAGKILDQSNMTQHNYDQAKGWQTKVEGGTAYIGEIHIHGQPD